MLLFEEKEAKPKGKGNSLNGTCGLGDKLDQDLRTEWQKKCLYQFPGEDRGQVAERPVLQREGNSGELRSEIKPSFNLRGRGHNGASPYGR